MKRLIKLLNLREESGSALVIVAISMVALLGFTALAIDGGRLYSDKSQLQKTLDAAVLAGAQGLKTGESEAIANAIEVSQKNGFPLTESDLTVTSDSIKATKQINTPLTFAKVLGINNADVGATAKAIIAPLIRANGVAPIAIEEDQVPDGTALTCFNTGQNQGNCGFLALEGTGAPTLAEAIKNGSTYTVNSEVPIDTEPGEKWGPVRDAINYLIESDKDKPHCQDPATADYQCKRIIYVVIIDSWEDIEGRDSVNVTGLAAYWIEGFNNKTLIGQFIERFEPGELGDTTIGTLFGVKLVE
jgi:hypothetical protein